MTATKDEKIDVAIQLGKVFVDIDLASGAWTFALAVGECVVLIEKLTHAVFDVSMALPNPR
jgi:hypothetical protein